MLNKLYTQKGCQPFHDTELAIGEYYLIDALKKNDKVVFLGSTGHAMVEVIDAVSPAGMHLRTVVAAANCGEFEYIGIWQLC